MAWPNGQGWEVELTVPHAQVPGTGTHADFPVLLTRANLPDAMFDPSGNHCQTDGGDIRAGTASDMGTQLPLEVVGTITLDSATGMGDGKAEIWVKRDINTTTDTTFWLAWNTAGTTAKESDSGTFGRNAVWGNYHLVVHGEGTTLYDSTGNVAGNIDTGATSQAGMYGWGTGWTASTSHLPSPGTWDISALPFSLQGHGRLTGGAFSSGAIVSIGDSTQGADYIAAFVAGGASVSRFRYSVNASNVFEVSQSAAWQSPDELFTAIAIDGSGNGLAYCDRDGTKLTNTTTGLSFPIDTWDRFGLGCLADGSPSDALDGYVDEIRVANSALAEAWLDAEYNNQSDPSAFVSTGTPAAVGGGGTDALTANDISSNSSVSNPGIGQSHALTGNSVSSAASVSTPAVGQEHALTGDDVSSASSVSNPTLAENTGDNLLADDISAQPSVGTPSVGQVHALLAGDISAAPSVSNPALNRPLQISRGGGRIYPYPYPQEPKNKKPKVIHKLEPYEVSGPLSRQREIENWKIPDWDQEEWEASLKTLQYLEQERRVKRQKTTESALAIWLLAG